ncbi:MAG: 3-hydroxybutyryl-CoA dehydrogenase [Planctomycetes bacterium]|nr:3-hydroxybutyryl-CoA dehydrogenase [Planctomycetota bacterium]
MRISKVAVIGAGTMGAGIAQAAATAGLDVVLVDVNAAVLASAKDKIKARLEKAAQKGQLAVERVPQILARIALAAELKAAEDAWVVIEAVVEDLNVKQKVFAELDRTCRPETILATNTSALSVSAIADATQRPDRVVGMHFFNPPTVMKLVEVVSSRRTSEATLAAVEDLARKLDKVPVRVKESPGFVVNRLLMPMLNEAARLVQAGVATPEAVDQAMTLGAAHPMGPLALADLIGIDVLVTVLESLHRDLNDPHFEPCPLLREMVKARRLGRKTGQGFFKYA